MDKLAFPWFTRVILCSVYRLVEHCRASIAKASYDTWPFLSVLLAAVGCWGGILLVERCKDDVLQEKIKAFSSEYRRNVAWDHFDQRSH